ncbi:MAG TPA: XrtA/PEP-CTERM system TPR-repeat protein PrsT [Stellaceae bacterium]|nr:XrtA/PEP-CTERM system TPR-repeat protein PrsT [Stellaceae bacterium]
MVLTRPRGLCRLIVFAAALAAFAQTAPAANEPGNYLGAAQQYLKKGDLRSALIELRNAAREAPQDAKIRAELAKIYLALGDPVSAEIEARAARARGAVEAEYLPVLAEALLRQGKFADLLGQVQPGNRPPALESEARLSIGVAEASLHHERKAEAALRDAVRLDPGANNPKIALARFLITKNPDEANQIIDGVLARNPRLAAAIDVKGALLQAKGEEDSALHRYDEALRIDPKYFLARLARIEININEGKFAAADADLDPLLKTSPGNVQANYLRALELTKQKRYADADAILERISPAFDRLWQGYHLQGLVKFYLDQYAQAESALAKYIVHVPNDADAVGLAAVVALRQGAPARAIGYLKPLADKQSPNAKILGLLGNAYMTAGKAGLALEEYQKAAAIAPKNATIDTGVAVAKIATGKHAQGLAELEQVFESAQGAIVAGPTLVLAELHAGRTEKASAAATALVKRDAHNSVYQTLLGMVRLVQRDYAGAETAFRAAMALQPGFDAPARNLANLFLLTGRYNNAAKAYDDLLAKKPDDVTALLGLADIAIEQKNWTQAAGFINRARTAAPNDPAPGLKLVDFDLLRHNVANAKALANQLAAQFPTNPAILDALGRAQLAAGNKEQATSTYKRAHEVAPDSAPILARYVALLTDAKNFREAETVLQQEIARHPENRSLKGDLIRIVSEADGVDAGVAKAREFAKSDPNNAVYDIVSAGLYEKAGRQGDARALLEKAAAVRPADTSVAVALAGLYHRTGEPTKAEGLLESRLKDKPKDVALRSALASFYLDDKKIADAMREYQQLVAERPNDAAALNNLAWLYQQKGDLAKAREMAERALALGPRAGSIQDTLGWILLAQGKTDEALRHLTAASAAAPGNPSVQYHLAVALERSGNAAGARATLQKLLASGAAFADKPAAEKLLQQLKNG